MLIDFITEFLRHFQLFMRNSRFLQNYDHIRQVGLIVTGMVISHALFGLSAILPAWSTDFLGPRLISVMKTWSHEPVFLLTIYFG